MYRIQWVLVHQSLDLGLNKEVRSIFNCVLTENDARAVEHDPLA